MAPILDGRTLEHVWFRMLRGNRPRVGQRVERVQAVGKHLLVRFERGLVLDVHLGMTGSWRVSPDPPRPHPKLRVHLGTEAGHALCYAAPTIRTYVDGHDPAPIDALGPDLSDDEVDLAEVVRRSRAGDQRRCLADLLLDQRVAAGVGNVFKSECLHLAGLDPFTEVGSVDDDDLRSVWGIAHRQLVANRERTVRRTTPTGLRASTHVYNRHRRPCPTCGRPVRYAPAGDRSSRSTYWCSRCQPRR